MHELLGDSHADAGRESIGRIDALGWGLVFIWAGIAFLADVGWSAGILGVGLIALGAQAARRFAGLPADLFGLGMGLAMVAWGAWGFLEPRFGGLDLPGAFWPILFIAVGVVLVLRALLRGPRHGAGPAEARREDA